MQPVEQGDEQPLYRYAFGNVEFDEARGELRVDGQPVELEHRPLQVLACLLHHADEVVPREELFATVWGARPTVDNVLANAIAKLRKAFGADGHGRIVNLPRVGYRLHGPVERTVSGRRLHDLLALAAGQGVPGRGHFRLREQLGPARGNEVWLARHDKTGELRVYEFSADGERLAALKREATIHRLPRESLGGRNDFVRVIDWNFATAPFYLECEYGGDDLPRWAADSPGLAGLEQSQRLHLFLQIADAIAAAHGLGVLHKDIKPANVLMRPAGDGWQPCLADFGASRLLQPERQQELGITALGQSTITALSSLGYLYSLSGDDARALVVQRDVYRRALVRWGARHQYTLVEQLDLGSQEQEAGDLPAALADLRTAGGGPVAVSGERSPTVQAARAARADVLSQLGRQAEALALIKHVDPAAYQASTADPGRAPVLGAPHAQILLRMGRRADGTARMQQALRDMSAAGVPEEIARYREDLPENAVAAQWLPTGRLRTRENRPGIWTSRLPTGVNGQGATWYPDSNPCTAARCSRVASAVDAAFSWRRRRRRPIRTGSNPARGQARRTTATPTCQGDGR
jgi:DNA-binding winged helix-turn-helix (wHTH) protein